MDLIVAPALKHRLFIGWLKTLNKKKYWKTFAFSNFIQTLPPEPSSKCSSTPV